MRDVTCTRGEDGTVTCSIPQKHKHHSPTGFEIGYGGSGPADLALNILALAIGPAPDALPEPGEDGTEGEWEAYFYNQEARVVCRDGTVVHGDVWDLHQPLKWNLIATLPREGGTIAGVVVEAWIVAQQSQLAEAR